jgi:hypothetical protein
MLRPFLLPVAGAGTGLAIALAALFGPSQAPSTVLPPGYVALVNQRPILLSDFIAQVEATKSMPYDRVSRPDRKQILKDMIDEELMVQRALALDLPEQDTTLRKAMVDAVTNMLSARLMTRRPTDAELETYFNDHRPEYETGGTMNYTDIVMHFGGYQDADQTLQQAEADAAEAAFQLRSGTMLAQVMQHFGLVNSSRGGGNDEFDFAAKIHLGATLYAAASALTDGEISDPVADKDGVHIIIMNKRVLPHLSDFASARNSVYAGYTEAEHVRAERDELERLRANADIVIGAGEKP